jgi:thermitase
MEFAPGHKIMDSDVQAIFARHGVKVLNVSWGIAYLLETTDADAIGLARELTETGIALYVEPNSILSHLAIPNDTDYAGQQNWLAEMNCPAAWDTLKLQDLPLGPMPTVVVVDSGIDTTHPDLAANIVATNDQTGLGIADTTGHGTQCSGFAAAITNNAEGVASVGWGGSVVAVKVSHPNPDIFLIDSGLQWVLANITPPAVISMSFVGPLLTITYSTTFPALYRAGFFLVAGSGNSGAVTVPQTCLEGPLNSDFVLGTAAVDGFGGSPFARPPYSNYGPTQEFNASVPAVGHGALVACIGGSVGNGLITTNFDGGYTTGFIGTSFSTAILAGLVRYLMVANPALSLADIWYIVTNPANGHATTGFLGVDPQWINPPSPLVDLCLAAALRAQRSPYSGRRGIRR